MDNKLIRLTEADLHNIIRESVSRVLNEYGDSPLGQYNLGRLSSRNAKIYGDDRGVHGYSKQKVDANDSPLGKARLKNAYEDGANDQEKYMGAVDRNDANGKTFGKLNIQANTQRKRDLSDRNLKKKYRV